METARQSRNSLTAPNITANCRDTRPGRDSLSGLGEEDWRTGGLEDRRTGRGGDVTVRRPDRGRHGGEEALPAGVPATAGLRCM